MGIETFIKKEKIESGKDIKIPGNAKYIKMKSGYVSFFSQENGSKDIIEIPANSFAIKFPDYREHAFHINYGNPCFNRK